MKNLAARQNLLDNKIGINANFISSKQTYMYSNM